MPYVDNQGVKIHYEARVIHCSWCMVRLLAGNGGARQVFYNP